MNNMFKWDNILSVIVLIVGVIIGSWFCIIGSGLAIALNLYVYYEEKKLRKEIEELEAEKNRLEEGKKIENRMIDQFEEYDEMTQSKSFYIAYLNTKMKLSTGGYITFDKLTKENYSSFTSELIEKSVIEYCSKVDELVNLIKPFVNYNLHLKEEMLMKIIKKNHRKDVVKRLISA